MSFFFQAIQYSRHLIHIIENHQISYEMVVLEYSYLFPEEDQATGQCSFFVQKKAVLWYDYIYGWFLDSCLSAKVILQSNDVCFIRKMFGVSMLPDFCNDSKFFEADQAMSFSLSEYYFFILLQGVYLFLFIR